MLYAKHSWTHQEPVYQVLTDSLTGLLLACCSQGQGQVRLLRNSFLANNSYKHYATILSVLSVAVLGKLSAAAPALCLVQS